MVATEPIKSVIVAAALALPGVLPRDAQAQSAPERGNVSLKYLLYEDSQDVDVIYPTYTGNEPGKLKRVKVSAPAFSVVAPIGSRWALEGSVIAEEVSGATPRYYSDVSGATTSQGMEDKRIGGDVKVTRYFENASIGVGVTGSHEDDFRSRGISVDGRYYTADRNTTFNIGVGGNWDQIGSTNDPTLDERRKTSEVVFGITRALTRSDIVQVNLSYRYGEGYYSDPYKLYDKRPNRRKQAAGLVRWNHHFARANATLRTGYRYYRDSYGIRAHTFDLAWVQSVTEQFSLTPIVRYYTQSSARFYYDPVTDVAIYPAPLGNPTYSSADQRLSAFGAITLGLKAELVIGDWTTDVKVEQYEQRSSWRVGGDGSPRLDNFQATSLQLGVGKSF